jgi:hypothetical protein
LKIQPPYSKGEPKDRPQEKKTEDFVATLKKPKILEVMSLRKIG